MFRPKNGDTVLNGILNLTLATVTACMKDLATGPALTPYIRLVACFR